MRNKKQLIIGTLFFFLFVGTVYLSQSSYLDEFKTQEVLVAAEDLKRDTVLDEYNTTLMKIQNENITNNFLNNNELVLGKIITRDIKKYIPITLNDVDSSLLKPSKEHEIFAIPNEWISVLQGTLRRYDVINVYSVVNTSNEAYENEVLKQVTVAYVKDGNNIEIYDTSEVERYSGSSTPKTIELVLTKEEFKQLEQTYLNGYKLIFSR